MGEQEKGERSVEGSAALQELGLCGQKLITKGQEGSSAATKPLGNGCGHLIALAPDGLIKLLGQVGPGVLEAFEEFFLQSFHLWP